MTSSMQRSAAARRANAHHMAEGMRRLDAEVAAKLEGCGGIPADWHAIARRRDEPRREKVTLALEEDVLRFYRGMGRNYAGRINEVLRAYMHARLAGLLQGAETPEAERAAPARVEAAEPVKPAAKAEPGGAGYEGRMAAYLAAYAKVAGAEGEEIVRRIMREG